MAKSVESKVTRKLLVAGLNEDLSREYQAIISYVNYSQVLRVRLENQGCAFLRSMMPPMATMIMACETSMRCS